MDLVTWTGVFFSLVIENIGVPFPIEAAYLIAADLIKHGQSYYLWLIILTAGHLCGSLISYGIGWWGEEYLMKRFGVRPGFIKASIAIHGWYQRYGSYTIFATRFIGYVRPWASLVAGFAKIRWQPFLWWTLIGSLLFNILALEITVYFMHLWTRYGWLLRGMLIVFFLISFTAIYWLQRFGRQRL